MLLIGFSLLLSINVYATEPSFYNKSPEEGLWEALEYYDIQYKEIVYAQALLETGNFKSSGCRKKNNLFGLMQGKKLRTFNHWAESVKMYKEKIQSRHRAGEDYYKFLKRIRYATNPNYINVLKKIVYVRFNN